MPWCGNSGVGGLLRTQGAQGLSITSEDRAELGAASEQQQGVQTLLNEDNYPHRFNAKPKYGVKVFLIVLDLLKALQRFWAFAVT